ncbi:hypothetical protein C8A01DRAFT_13508 [Parachaetomium inaequale]|uniref:Chromo domain-containing protein n=1 Tax=Parachaetomium inaequale TaxID=2588326 RepID=A0AAN6PKW6_9PEZI|nr:hypothetical protein C8A01DRAFT_13508 [Parachaetomium inaequale]
MTKRSTARPTKQKRRRPVATREPTPEEEIFEVRDILDEKLVKGKLLYKVDWADNPTTGERYDPTWEPAENVTAAAVTDWENEKRRRQGIAPESSHPSLESDSQPVLPPNWRAKRRREPSAAAAEEDERAPTRSRRSVDSGYTSTDGDLQSSCEEVQSVPHNNNKKLVLELSRPPDFDPSEYRLITSSQLAPSAPSSQIVDAAPSQGDSNQHAGGRASQRTIPDSQDGFDSLRTTQSTAQSTARAQEQASNTEGQISRSDFDIPSRQPEGVHSQSRPSSRLLDESGRSISPSSARFEPQLEYPSEDSPLGEGFLTQPDYDLPFSGTESGPSRIAELLSGNKGRKQHQEHELSQQSAPAPGINSFLTGSDSHPHFQAAQQSSLPAGNPGLLTQLSEAGGQSSADIVPETALRPPKRRSPSRIPSQSASSPRGKETAQPSTPAKERQASVLFTPRNRDMDGEGTPRPSAREKMRQLRAQVFGTSPAVPPAVPPAENRQEPALVSPSAVLPQIGNFAEQLEASAAPADSSELQTSLGEQPVPSVGHLDQQAADLNQHTGMDLAMTAETGIISGQLEFEQPPATVAPADLTTSLEHIPVSHDDLPAGNQILGGGTEHSAPISLDQPDRFGLELSADEQDEDDSHGKYLIVTLPMAANTRAKYLDTISQNKAAMIKFGEVFANSYSSLPDASLVAKIDAIFDRLLNLCDLPAYDDDLPELGKVDMMKHATNSNSKFSFVYEFLNGLWDINARILILSQPGRVFEYLEAVVSVTDCPYTILGQEGSTGQSTEGTSVVLAVAGQDLSKVQGGVDVVIAYDHTARSVELPDTLGFESMAPMVLSLVATYSLDHIEQQLVEQQLVERQLVEQDLDGLERRNALNLATGTAMEYLRTPERQSPEPHEAAKTFATFLRNPEAGLHWEPHPLPGNIFNIWLSSQQHTQESQADLPIAAGGRKRPLDNLNVDEGIPKRPRLLESQLPSRNSTPARTSDLLKQTLANHPVAGPSTQMLELPVEQLEKMSAKIAELEARLVAQSAIEAKTREHCLSLESQLRSHERTVQSLQPKYMDALRDRGTFEKQCQKAVDQASAATERLEAQKAENEALKEKNRMLESKLAEANNTLANSTIPEIARLAQAEKDREEALATVEKLEKKIRGVQNEVDYSRKAYQDASNAYTELNREHQELKSKFAESETKASGNLRAIHAMHAESELNDQTRHIDELQAMLENRERELERAKEELKFSRNGRRETRQGSVPRSPRMGVMSPRPARGMGAGSRGTSPAPMSSDGPGENGGVINGKGSGSQSAPGSVAGERRARTTPRRRSTDTFPLAKSPILGQLDEVDESPTRQRKPAKPRRSKPAISGAMIPPASIWGPIAEPSPAKPPTEPPTAQPFVSKPSTMNPFTTKPATSKPTAAKPSYGPAHR